MAKTFEKQKGAIISSIVDGNILYEINDTLMQEDA
jgi:hypothetical protein